MNLDNRTATPGVDNFYKHLFTIIHIYGMLLCFKHESSQNVVETKHITKF